MAAPIMLHSCKIDEVDKSQVLRYAGMAGSSVPENINELIDKCMPKMLEVVNLKACYLDVPVMISENTVSFECMSIESKNLSVLLKGCESAILVAATAGIQVDMMIKRALVTSKAEALILNSVAIAAIEKYMSLLNGFFKSQYSGYELRPRYSPGYGDVDLSVQKDLLRVLDTNRKIGVSLSESLLMKPEKSVSAIIGIGKEGCVHIDRDCDICSKKDCEFRLT